MFSAVDGLLRLLVDKGRFYHRESFYPTAPSQTDVVDVTISSMDYVLPSDVQLTGIQEVSTYIAVSGRIYRVQL